MQHYYGVDRLTFGAELEFADVKYGQPLPPGHSWNRMDYSIVNSNGIANCERGKYYGYGGEINTKPTDNIDEAVADFEDIINWLAPKPVINYRCNLHIHVGIRGLRDDIVMLKRVLRYITLYQDEIFLLIEPIPVPTRKDYPLTAEFEGALKRYKRRQKSHQSTLKQEQTLAMLVANSTQEFYDAHFLTSKDGRLQKQLHQRCGINLRSLWENDETIEFRHFPGTLNPQEFRSAMTWCKEFIMAAMGDQETPARILHKHPEFRFPLFKPYIHELEEGWKKTGHGVHPSTRKANIARVLDASVPSPP